MNRKKTICIVIPARYHSTRLEAKALIDLGGKSMLERVYIQAKKSTLANNVVVATDHPLIFKHCEDKNINVVLTSDKHSSGTERICEVAQELKYDIYINVQGDEPLINPNQIDDLIHLFLDTPTLSIATQCSKILNAETLLDFNIVKVVKDINNRALLFSRTAIPAFRDLPYRDWHLHHTYYKHHGIYGYTSEALSKIKNLGSSVLEKAESLEQLKWMDHGLRIKCVTTKYESIGVDTAEDLQNVINLVLSKT